ncbi:DUF5753 domain-containing protein [Sphaerisporangium corydalis]|uniref:DUF5753 domain-containing protein n=1 Tax=Sphaerisporangium corydalis TaxID=1441875 RepID=A0ABV9EIN1_9ACTN|nr:DUF5753 domain-containing protein [Sphaerisporangium corydalis]
MGITILDLTRVLDLYEVEDDKRKPLFGLARTARTRGWWDAYADSVPSDYATYIELEADASFIRSYDALAVNGLLQTADYAQEIIRAALMGLSPPGEVKRRVEVRLTRQKLFALEDGPLRLWAVIDESVLTRVVGSHVIMAAQCAALLAAAELPNVTIQVLPLASGAHPASAGPFSIMEFREPYDPDVVYVESMTSSLYVESDADIYRYTLAFDHLRASAMAPDESKSLIARVADRFSC